MGIESGRHEALDVQRANRHNRDSASLPNTSGVEALCDICGPLLRVIESPARSMNDISTGSGNPLITRLDASGTYSPPTSAKSWPQAPKLGHAELPIDGQFVRALAADIDLDREVGRRIDG
jgi:hypothetical protein